MKEELIRVLNSKLDDLNSDIDSLVEINNKINDENNNLSYVSGILDLFKNNDENNILNFSKLNREDFDNVLDIIGSNAKEVFNTDSCNYDGLVYLINGINNGISLNLNEEQKNGIKFLINELNNKVDEYSSAIDGYELVKTRYEISDVSVLEKKREEYKTTISNLGHDDYIENTDLLMEALNYCDLPEEQIIDMLAYVLEYNASVYKEKGPKTTFNKIKEEPSVLVHETLKEEDNHANDEISFESNTEDIGSHDTFALEENEHHIAQEESDEKDDTTPLENTFHFNNINESSISEFNPITFDEPDSNEWENKEIDNQLDNEKHDEIIPNEFDDIRIDDNLEKEISDDAFNTSNQEEYSNEVVSHAEPENIDVQETNTDDNNFEIENNLETQDTFNESYTPRIETPIDNDFKDVIDTQEDYEDAKEREVSSTRDLQKLFDKYGIKEENVYLNELVAGDVNKYQDVLETLKNRGLTDKITGNLLVEILLNSTGDNIVRVLEIIENDLSVDKEDYDITLKIAIDTIPSIFVNSDGNYQNFIDNVVLFKELGLNLINLFDFSKEVFVADNSRIVKNLEIVKQYGFEITYKNAKYMLLLPNIGDRLDYYVESVYEDKLKGATFDGVDYIKEYAAKLNVVTDETIKRIRYSSENGKKVFGSKPGSLTGEITNLRVNALDISSDYLNRFFNNDFANLTGDEVRECVRLIHESSNVGNYRDELEILNPYQKGLRYIIEGINISSNKVIRNYNILRSYGMDKQKSLEFAVCYNLVITKEEYDRLESKLEEIGGNL